MKQFEQFEAIVPENFEQLMIDFWIRNENAEKEEVLAWYFDDNFKAMNKRIAGKRCTFKPDLGYSSEEVNGTLCFELEDNDYVIPVSILEVV